MDKSETFRWKRSSPNLQNISIRTEEGKEIMKAFLLPIEFHTGPLFIIEEDPKKEEYNEQNSES